MLGAILVFRDITQRRAQERALEVSEQLYRATFDLAPIGIAHMSLDGKWLQLNDAVCVITGYSREELQQLSFADLTHPDHLEAAREEARRLATGERASSSMEKRYIAKGGQVVWNNLTVALVRNTAGEPDYFISIIDDIGARKQAEAEQKRYQGQLRLMINELNHRVKNTLATVQSMASQTLRGESDPEIVYEKLEARLLGLSQAHDVLTR